MELIILIALILQSVVIPLTSYFLIYKPLSSFMKHLEGIDNMKVSFLEMKTSNQGLDNSVKSLEKRIDAIFVIDSPERTPNQATEEVEEGVEFSEDNIFDLPKEVKVEVEGGDTMIPPQFMQ